MNFILAALALVLGLGAGFVVNVISTRLSAGRPMLGPLRCVRSGHPLRAWQVFPVLGYLLQRGRCAYCGKRLPPSYPATEMLAGSIFAGLALLESAPLLLAFHAFYATVLLLVLVIDWKHRDIYFSVIGVGSFAALVGSFLLPGIGLVNALIGAGVAGGFFLLAYLLAKLIFPHIEEPLGGGDVLLALMMGLMLGFPNVVGALLIGPLMAGAAALLLLLSRRANLGSFMPYGVALCAASILFLVYPTPFAEALRLPALVAALSNLFL